MKPVVKSHFKFKTKKTALAPKPAPAAPSAAVHSEVHNSKPLHKPVAKMGSSDAKAVVAQPKFQKPQSRLPSSKPANSLPVKVVSIAAVDATSQSKVAATADVEKSNVKKRAAPFTGEKSDEAKKAKRENGYDLDDKRTVFVRNLPYGSASEDIKEAITKVFPDMSIESVFIVKDATGQPKGTAFLKLGSSDEAEKLITSSTQSSQPSAISDFYQGAAVSTALEGFTGGVMVGGRRLSFHSALKKTELQTTVEAREQERSKMVDKSRNLHLLREGLIDSNSSEFKKLSPSEKRQREDSLKERNYKASNPNFFINPTRLSVRNLPVFIDGHKLMGAALTATKNATQRACGVLKATIIKDREREERSKGYGFIDFSTHEAAMTCLKALNNNASAVSPGNRKSPIVEFAFEDKRKLRIQELAKERHSKAAKARADPEKPKRLGRGKKQREKKRLAKAALST